MVDITDTLDCSGEVCPYPDVKSKRKVKKMNSGEALKKHITPVDVNFYILEGNGIVEIGEESANVIKDQLIFSPAKIPHTLMNDSDKNFRFLVIKTPTPTSETKLL